MTQNANDLLDRLTDLTIAAKFNGTVEDALGAYAEATRYLFGLLSAKTGIPLDELSAVAFSKRIAYVALNFYADSIPQWKVLAKLDKDGLWQIVEEFKGE